MHAPILVLAQHTRTGQILRGNSFDTHKYLLIYTKLLPPFRKIRFFSIVYIYIDTNKSRYINVDDAKKSYIMKRREKGVQPSSYYRSYHI